MGALNATVLYKWQDDRNLWVLMNCVPSGSYVTGGDTLSFTAAGVPGVALPRAWAGTATQAGNLVTFIPGATRDAGKMRFNLAAGTEKTASAYGTDTFNMLFLFPALI